MFLVVDPITIKCGYCGHENKDGQKFCNDCGTELSQALPSRPDLLAILRGQVRSPAVRGILSLAIFAVAYILSLAIIDTAGWLLRDIAWDERFQPEIRTLLGSGPCFLAFAIAMLVACAWWRRSRAMNIKLAREITVFPSLR